MFSKLKDWVDSTFEIHDSQDNGESSVEFAAAILLLEVSRADYDISIAEKKIIAGELAKQFNLGQSKTNALLQYAVDEHEHYTSSHPFIRLLNEELDIAAKQQLLEGLWRVAYADKELDKYEEYHIRKIADWLYLPHADFIRLKNKVLRELGIPQ